jgi:tetratricopeptide (TPR) repeat protein
LALPHLLVLILWAGAPASAQLNRAEVYFNQGYNYQTGRGVAKDPDKARQNYEEALRYNPEAVPVLYNLGVVYYGQGKQKEAMSYFGKAVKVARGAGGQFAYYEAVSSIGVGSCYQKEGKLREAEQWFRSAVRLQPALGEAHFDLINLLLKARRLPEAEEALKVADKQAPNPSYRLLYGRLKGHTGPQQTSTTISIRYVAIGVLVLVGLFSLYALLRKARGKR